MIEPEDQHGQIFDLGDELTIGRAAGCGVRVEDSYTSSLHARLFRRDGTLWVEDLELHQRHLGECRAHRRRQPSGKGDLLQVGGTVFEVSR